MQCPRPVVVPNRFGPDPRHERVRVAGHRPFGLVRSNEAGPRDNDDRPKSASDQIADQCHRNSNSTGRKKLADSIRHKGRSTLRVKVCKQAMGANSDGWVINRRDIAEVSDALKPEAPATRRIESAAIGHLFPKSARYSLHRTSLLSAFQFNAVPINLALWQGGFQFGDARFSHGVALAHALKRAQTGQFIKMFQALVCDFVAAEL